MKLAHHMQSIPNATIDFETDKDYQAALPRDESRMTIFFNLFGAVKGYRQDVFCHMEASDFRSIYAKIRVMGNKKVYLYYGLRNEEYDECPIHRENDQGTEKEQKVEETEEAYIQRISDAPSRHRQELSWT